MNPALPVRPVCVSLPAQHQSHHLYHRLTMSVQRWLKTTFSSLAPLKSGNFFYFFLNSFLEASHLIHHIIPNVVSYCVKWLRDQSAPAAAAAGWRVWRLQTFCSHLKVSHFCLPGSRTCVTQEGCRAKKKLWGGRRRSPLHTAWRLFWTWNYTRRVVERQATITSLDTWTQALDGER